MPKIEIAQTSLKLSSTQQKLHVWHLKCIKLINITQVLLAFLTTTFWPNSDRFRRSEIRLETYFCNVAQMLYK